MKLNKNHIVWHTRANGIQLINMPSRYMGFNTLSKDGSCHLNTCHVSYSHVIYFNQFEISVWNWCSPECLKALAKEII